MDVGVLQLDMILHFVFDVAVRRASFSENLVGFDTASEAPALYPFSLYSSQNCAVPGNAFFLSEGQEHCLGFPRTNLKNQKRAFKASEVWVVTFALKGWLAQPIWHAQK
eukprot:5283882-Amphidinium_carterae.1